MFKGSKILDIVVGIIVMFLKLQKISEKSKVTKLDLKINQKVTR